MLVELSCQPDPKKPAKKVYRLNGKKLVPYNSQQIINHSPDGFNHGYEGSGPAQLALAICLELFGRKPALHLYQEFKRRHIAGLGHGGKGEAQQEHFVVMLDVSEYADRAIEHGYRPK